MQKFRTHHTMDVQYRDKKLTPEERVKTIEGIDKLISQYAASIPIYHEEKMKAKEGNVPIKPLASLLETIYSTGEFIVMVIADCAVAQKFFLSATNDYDKRFARGKLKVLLNEGFKKVYGFMSTRKNAKRNWIHCWMNFQFHHCVAVLQPHCLVANVVVLKLHVPLPMIQSLYCWTNHLLALIQLRLTTFVDWYPS